MNPDLQRLHPYPFQRLNGLLEGIEPNPDFAPINLSIGEPKHQPPGFVLQELQHHMGGLSQYPLTKGSPHLRAAIARWLIQRFSLDPEGVDPDRQVLPVNGTREALFAFAQCAIDRTGNPLVVMPNPFYQIYEGAALLAGAEPYFVNATASTGYLPDFEAVPDAVWRRCQLLYLCSPGNPSGAVAPLETLKRLIEMADRYDFIIAADECYSEIYPDESNPPPGLLTAATQSGRRDFARCVVFHSLSKRSSLPGLRSGFVAGDAAVLESFLLYRTYHGCAMPLPAQMASQTAWSDEEHVARNRRAYRDKFDAVLEILKGTPLAVDRPDAGFYLWPRLPIPDDEFARRLFAEYNVRLLPGSYLSREANGINPGDHRVRIALVAPLDECVDAAERVGSLLNSL